MNCDKIKITDCRKIKTMSKTEIVKRIPGLNLKIIADSGQCFRMTENEPGVFILFSGAHALRIFQKGNLFRFECSEKEFAGVWQDYFDLHTDYWKIVRTVDPADAWLSDAVKQADGLRVLKQDFFETLITFIISQQNNIPRIKRCVGLLCERYGKRKRRSGIGEYSAFPEAEVLAAADEKDLLSCNLGYRARYVKEASAQIEKGEADLRALQKMSDAEAKAELLQLTGVGTKVADCVMLFALHRIDSFPVDTHIRQMLAEHYPDGFPFERYEGFSGILQQFLFYSEIHKEKKPV
jgi:N-glycosylase/DNA lyase